MAERRCGVVIPWAVSGVGGARVVIENGDDVSALAQAAALRAAGFDTAICRGPGRTNAGPCPLRTAGSCPILDAADVVLFDLDLDDPRDEEVLALARRSYPDVPIVLEVPTSTAHQHRGVLAGCHVVAPFDEDKLVAAVRAATVA